MHIKMFKYMQKLSNFSIVVKCMHFEQKTETKNLSFFSMNLLILRNYSNFLEIIKIQF